MTSLGEIELIGGPLCGEVLAFPDWQVFEIMTSQIPSDPFGTSESPPDFVAIVGVYRRALESTPLKDGKPQPWPFHWEGWRER